MKLLRDPLIHFLLFGALLFAFHAVWSHLTDRADRQLIVDTREIARQSDLFGLENGRPPNDAELRGIIFSFVEEDVLAREARRLGLDVDDTVVRRRLAQKMRLLSDTTPIDPPTDEALQAWFDARADDYVQDERRSLQHVFFSDEGRDDPVADALAANLSDWSRVGDPFIVARQLPLITRAKLQQDYGGAFARATFEADVGDWSEPVRSPFGIHRIRVTDTSARVAPKLADVRERVLSDWMDEARTAQAAQSVRDMIARYDVVIEE